MELTRYAPLVFVWSPTEGTRRLIPSLILVALLVGGAETLRRQAIGEFPAETTAAWSQRWRDRFDSIRARAQTSRHGDAGEPAADRISQLERLADLHRAGVLSDEELAREKSLIRG